jgi:hypothetical protein
VPFFWVRSRDSRSVIPGGLAQLGERLHGMQEVMGSSPISSTLKALWHKDLR